MSMRLNKRHFYSLFLWTVAVPFTVFLAYLIFLSNDRYVSSTQIVVRQSGSESGRLPGIAVLLGSANTTSREETLYLKSFVTSIDMLKVLNQKLDWKKHYSRQTNDILFLLDPEAPVEDVLKFYNRMITAHLDETNGLLQISVQAYDPNFSRLVLETILEESEIFVNELSHRMARDQMSFAADQLDLARENLREQQTELISFQKKNNAFDAQADVLVRSEVIGEIESELTRQRAELNALRATLNENAPQVKQLRQKISGALLQLEKERRMVVSSADTKQLNMIALQYRNLVTMATISEEAYKLGVTALENARIEASKKMRSLVIVVSPNLAEMPLLPQRLYNLVSVLLALLLIYGILRFVVATIKDHRD